MTIQTEKLFTLSLTTFGTLALLASAAIAKHPYLAAEYFTSEYRDSLVTTVQRTNALWTPECDRIKGRKPVSKKPNAFVSAMDFHKGVTQLSDLVRTTDSIVDGYQSKIPQLRAKKGQLDGKATVRTRRAFASLVDDTIALIETEGKKVRQLPYQRNGGSSTEDLTSYQMHVNCSVQGLQTVEDMLLNGKDNDVCRKVLANYYPEEAKPPQKAPNRLHRLMNWAMSWWVS